MNLMPEATKALADAKATGLAVILDQTGDIRLRYPQVRREELLPLIQHLRSLRTEIAVLLRQQQRRQALAHLLPYINKKVWTPDGRATLVEVEDHLTVEFTDGRRMRYYDPTAIALYADESPEAPYA